MNKQKQGRTREREQTEREIERRRAGNDKRRVKQAAASNLPHPATSLRRTPMTRRRRSKGVGVSYDQLKTQIPEAIRACELAVQLLPTDLTSQYQLARAVELVDPPRGQSMQDKLVKKGYPAAFDNAGSLLLHDRNCRQHCVNEAVKLFKKGADLGDPRLDDELGRSDRQRSGQGQHDRALPESR